MTIASVTIERASQGEVDAISRLLKQCSLPWEDVAEHLDHFLVARDGPNVIGVVGLEVRETGSLLRSLAVDARYRGIGLGIKLSESILQHARTLKVKTVGLLTTTAEDFFGKGGFHRVEKSAIPDFVTGSKEYRLYCPSTAVCMVKNL